MNKTPEQIYEEIQKSFFLIAGPCVIESEEIIMKIAEEIKIIQESFHITTIFKASFDKANRSSINSFRGLGMQKGLEILQKVKKQFQLPILTDIHESYQAEICKDIIDIIQIPAFLCRQTELLIAAANTDKIVNIKKGQFLSGKEMLNAINKVKSINNKLLITERGNIFGYGNLIVDYRNLIEMQKFDYPVIFDATHSTQKPGALGESSGGDREYTQPLACAAASVGIKGFFMEVHPEPEKALSDKENCLDLKNLKQTIKNIMLIHQANSQFSSVL